MKIQATVMVNTPDGVYDYGSPFELTDFDKLLLNVCGEHPNITSMVLTVFIAWDEDSGKGHHGPHLVVSNGP